MCFIDERPRRTCVVESDRIRLDSLATLLTRRRIELYPRLILIVIAAVFVLNIAGSTGWRGLGGQLLFPDFHIFYSAGTLLHRAPESLYDFKEQLSLQRSLVAPTPLPGTGAFSHPPYVAPLFEMFTALSLPVALILWNALSAAALGGALWLAVRLIRRHPWSLDASTRVITVAGLSTAPVLFGLHSGQMHSFILLGSIAVVVLVLDGKSWQAGAIVGLLAIKPQIALSFGLLFIVRRDLRACIAAAVTFAGLNGLLIGRVGFDTALSLHASYLDTTRSLLLMPFTEGFPSYLLLTPYGLMSGVVGPDRQGTILLLSNVVAVGILLWFLVDGWRMRNAQEEAAMPLLLGRTLLLPSLLTPYLMMYDAAPLLVACLLIVPPTMPRRMLDMGARVYGALWVYPPVSAIIGVPLGALVPIGLWIASSKTGLPASVWRRITPGGGNEPSSPGCAGSACGLQPVGSFGVGAGPAIAGEGRGRVDGTANS